MKILLSAYACEPNKGSEQGVGWSWAVELSKHHEVWVVTRDNNEPTISAYIKEHPEYAIANLHFLYVGLSKKYTFWKKGNRGIRLYNTIWQWKASKVARKYHKKIGFDIVHHVTFVSYTQATYMYKLDIPLIWGPISGGENIPKQIHIGLTKKERIIETIRMLSQTICLFMPSIKKTMKKARYILVATEETKDKIPQKYLDKTIVMPAIGLDYAMNIRFNKQSDDNIKIIMAGRLIYWKAFDIGIKAFLKLRKKFSNIELHILGEGNQKERLKQLAGVELDRSIFFEEKVSHDEIFDFYSNFDIFLNTTLRDSGCMAMMEAISVGVPAVAIATGGPAVLLSTDDFCAVKPLNYEYCVHKVSEILECLVCDAELRNKVAQQQKDRVFCIYSMNRKYEKLQAIMNEV